MSSGARRPQTPAGRASHSHGPATGAEPATNGTASAIAAPGLYVVDLRDDVNAELAGHAGCAYVSPPQPREQALALVAVLLGSAVVPPDNRDTWTRAVAGGQRTIALRAAPMLTAARDAPETETSRANELPHVGA